MPVVRTLDGPQVEQAALPGARLSVRANPDAFGTAVAQGVGDIASVSQRIYLEEKAKADQYATQDAVTRTKLFADQRFDDKTSGLFVQNLGKDAFPAVDKTLADLDKHAAEVESSLANETQKQAYRQWAADYKLARKGQADDYAFKQKTAYEDQVAETAIRSYQSDALNFAHDPMVVQTAADDADNLVRAHGANRGLPPEVIEEQAAAVRSQIHASTISALLVRGDDVRARQRFETFGGEIQGEDRLKVERELAIGSTAGESQRQALAIYRDDKPLDVMVAEADKIADVQVRDATVRRLEERRSQHLQAMNERQRTTAKAIYEAMNDPRNPLGWDDPALIPLKATLDPDQQEALKRYGARESRVETDWGTYQALRRAAVAEPQRFAALNLYADPAIAGRLGATEFKELVDLQAKIASDGTGSKARQELAEIKGFDEVTRQTLGPIVKNLTVSKKNPDNELIIGFERALRDRVTRMQLGRKERLTQAEVQAEADRLIVSQVVQEKRGAWSPMRLFGDDMDDVGSRYAFQDPAVAGEAFAVDQVPVEDRDSIVRLLKRQGRPVSDGVIVSTYNTLLRGQKPAAE